MIAAQAQTPIRRLVLNDFGARVSAASLRRIGAYLRRDWSFVSLEEAEAHLREIHAPFGTLTDAQWRHLAEHGTAERGDGRLRFRHDPGIAMRFAVPIMFDVVLWPLWEAIQCDVLIMRGESSDLLAPSTVAVMPRRGASARAGRVAAVEVQGCGHAPALMDTAQIDVVRDFLMGRGADPVSPVARTTIRTSPGAMTP